MSLGIYIHIPYCLQRCRYCDFTTFEWDKILPPEKYIQWVKKEIQNRHSLLPTHQVHSIYFGGGTPSLLDPKLIISLLDELNNAGFQNSSDCEITIEINPATVSEKNLDEYLKHGVNRFSVGAQSFDDPLLIMCGRRHSSKDTRITLDLLKAAHVNYSFDLLFALPGQTFDQLKYDLNEVAKYSPPHLSAYCLTVPEGHPMSFNRPSEDLQIEMFDLIESELSDMGIKKYEISNFSKVGFRSRHNMTYWNDQNYWGLGLSAHSYFNQTDEGPFGVRFWNPKSFDEYEAQVFSAPTDFVYEPLASSQIERLKPNEALTDFCHMHLRTMDGLALDAAQKKLGEEATRLLEPLNRLTDQKLLLSSAPGKYKLSPRGQKLSNLVFEALTFLPEPQKPIASTVSISS